jgi:TetR/AcrR family transcriptional regulator, transcriptional repressor for nem operon
MPISARRKAAIRSEIFEHAARLFRLRGYSGTNIDDIMLAAGLTRGSFYAHFPSKDDLFAEVIRAGHGLLARARAGGGKTAIAAYLDKADLTANVQACTLAALPGDVARAPLAARLAYANALHALIAELASGRARKLDGAATTAAILSLGAVILARASGDTRLSDWLLRCARRAALAQLAPPKPKPKRATAKRASPKLKRSRSRRKGAAARRPKRTARSRGGRA